MINYRVMLACLFLFCGISQAAETCNTLIKEYQNKPHDRDEKQLFLDSNGYYLTYDRCSDSTDIEIISLEERVQMGFIPRDLLSLPPKPYHYNCIFRTVRVEYTIKCSNNLKYKGTEYLLSSIRNENESLDVSGEEKAKMEAETHWWIPIPLDYLNSDGSITIDPVTGKEWKDKPRKLDIASIKERWVKQAVSCPKYTFMGTPRKLPRPVLLIHGLNGNYGQWGVETYDKNSSEYKEGKVKGYTNGSLPDMLARSNNLYTEKDSTTIDGVKYSINSNGIYFFQATENSFPHWDAIPSQSQALYEKIKFIMDNYYKEQEKQGIKWSEVDDLKIDLVGHSQGGLVIREMLRGLRDDPGDITEEGTANAANHINRVITVNTPHLGSALATPSDNLSKIEPELLNGLSALIGDIDNPVERTLIKANVDIDFWDKSSMISRKALDINPVLMYGLLGVAWSGLGLPVALGIGVAATDVTLTIKGPYIGVYKSEVFIDVPGPWNKTIRNDITALKEYADELLGEPRSKDYLYKNSPFMARLNESSNFFPKRPDGSWVTMLPMYSDSANKMIPDLFADMGEEADRLCAMGDKDPNCFAVGAALKNYAFTETGYNISKPNFDKGLWDMLVNLQNGWLVKGDAVVEASSQKFYKLLDTSSTFLAPRSYAIHDALAPWEPVIHGPYGKYDGATQQGLDLLCALSPKCDNAFALAQQGGKNAILKLSEIVFNGEFSERSLKVTGNFDLASQYISEGTQAFSISANGETILRAEYEPGKGSSITLNYNGTEQTVLMLGPEFATQPSMSRTGDSVFVTFTNYSGKSFKESYFLPELPQNVTATVIVPIGSTMSPVIIGSAVASDPETQKPPVPPPGHRLAPITLAVIHREARGEYESNTSRPRFLVYNTTNDTLEFSKVAYYFTADPVRKPNVVVDYPYVPVSVENLGGDQWRFVLDVGNQKIAPKGFYPSVDGWQLRVHYSDWHEYEHINDWSADYSLGMIQLNRKIVVYDKNGKIVWGNEAPGFESEDNGIIPTAKGTIAWKDDAPWETNAFKPRVTVKNTGSLALSNYHAQLWFRVPQGKNLSPLDIWYAPESSPSVKSVINAGGRVWMLDMHFDEHILYPSDSVSEGNIGLHLTDWSLFDKTVCGIVLKDKDGNVLFGREPSVAECESYNGPELLAPLYSRK